MINRNHSGELILTRSVAWTASDSVPISQKAGIDFPQLGISVNADGNLAIRTMNQVTKKLDPAVTIAVKAGIIYPWSVEYVMSTNTTATGIVLHG